MQSKETTSADIEKGNSYNILEDDKMEFIIGIDDETISNNINFQIEKVDSAMNHRINAHALGTAGSAGDDSSISLSSIYSIGNDSNDLYFNRLQKELTDIQRIDASTNGETLRLNGQSNLNYLYDEVESLAGSSHIDSDSDLDDSASCLTDRIKPKYRKLTYEDVENSLNKYKSKEEAIISEMELLITFLRGQVYVFKQSNRITLQKYNMLMFPAMSITAGMTVLAPFFEDVQWSGWAISILNALLTVMIAMNNFMKWQAIAELYMNISNQYENLMVSVEMTRNHFDFIEDPLLKKKYIIDKMKETEMRIMDVKLNYNNIIVPYEIQVHNPIISHVNIFSFIRKIEDYKRCLILKYKDIKNEINYIMYKWEKDNNRKSEPLQSLIHNKKETDVKRLEWLLKKKEEVKNQLIHNNTTNVYQYIDNLFTREIAVSEAYYTYHTVGMHHFFPPKSYEKLQYGNPVVDAHLNFVFTTNPEEDNHLKPV
jgi:hypothetical protein